MIPPPHAKFEALSDPVLLPSQYDDLFRRRARMAEGEYRLLWAVLENGIRSYLANMDCSTSARCSAFEEACSWFHPAEHQPQDLFAFQSLCDLLGIDATMLLKGLESIQLNDLAIRQQSRGPGKSRAKRLGGIEALAAKTSLHHSAAV